MNKKQYRSDAMAAIHETMESLHRIGAIDKQTMRRFDETCLTQVKPLTPEEIRALRERECVSQTVFAHYLNVTTSVVSKWERGEKRPSPPHTKAPLIDRKARPLIRRLIGTKIPPMRRQSRDVLREAGAGNRRHLGQDVIIQRLARP